MTWKQVMAAVLCIASLSTVAYADRRSIPFEPGEVPYYYREENKDKAGSAKLLDKESQLYTVVHGKGKEHILKNYKPTRTSPLVSLLKDPDAKDISKYQVEADAKYDIKPCETCGEEMIFVNILYEKNPCGHGVFTFARYCQQDDELEPIYFFDRCGCYVEELD